MWSKDMTKDSRRTVFQRVPRKEKFKVSRDSSGHQIIPLLDHLFLHFSEISVAICNLPASFIRTCEWSASPNSFDAAGEAKRITSSVKRGCTP